MTDDACADLRPDQRQIEPDRNGKGRPVTALPVMMVVTMPMPVTMPVAVMATMPVPVVVGVVMAVAMRIVMVVLHGRFPSRRGGVAQMPQRSKNVQAASAGSAGYQTQSCGFWTSCCYGLPIFVI
jgi:hypothetical protein